MVPLVKAIFHVHTAWSHDASMSPQTLINACLTHGVDVLAVTDHNEIDGAIAVQKKAPFPVIVGEEIRTKEGGEVIGLYLTDHIPKGTPVRECLKRIHDQGGLTYLPHPFDDVRSKKFPNELLEDIVADVDIVETFNARNVKDICNTRAMKFAEKHKKPASSGADAHIPPEIGRTYMHLPAWETPQELLVSLQSMTPTNVRNPLWVHVASKWYKLTKKP